MPFQPGHKLSPGRQKGSMNRRSIEALKILEELDYCPIKKGVHIALEAEKQYEFYKEKVSEGRFSPMEDNAPTYLKIMSDTNKDLAGYVYAKLKAVEQIRVNATDGWSLEQKLEASKALTHMLEMQLKTPSDAGDI